MNEDYVPGSIIEKLRNIYHLERR